MCKLPVMLAFFLTLVFACGERGEPASKKPTTSQDTVNDPSTSKADTPSTYVLTDIISYPQTSGTSCLRSDQHSGHIPNLELISVDGKFSEWATVPVAISDPLGDASSQVDFGSVQIARKNGDLAFAIATSEVLAKQISLEFGGAYQIQGRFEMLRRRLYRFEGDRLFELKEYEDSDRSEWIEVEDAGFQARFGQSGLELVLRQHQLSEVLTWPIVWIKVYSTINGNLSDIDASSNVAFASTISDEKTSLFSFLGCQFWQGQSGSIQIKLVVDREAKVESRHQIEPVDDVAAWSFELVRAGFDAASRELGGLVLPVGETTVFVTNSKMMKDPNVPSGVRYPHSVYNGAFLYAYELAKGSSEFYPQGAIIEQSITHFIKLNLIRRFPSASDQLVRIVSQALVDYVIRKTLGYAYWLDHYLEPVKSFLVALDSKIPRPLENERWLSKEISLGHILGLLVEPAQLLEAWSLASDLSKHGVDLHLALLDALKQSISQEDKRHRLDRLWNGWIRSAEYAQEFNPDQLLDHDSDGIPSLFETLVTNTNPQLADTDADGWTDFSEVIVGGDPRAASVKPSVLVPDGSFADWLELLPQQVIVDRGHTGACPKAADISHYAAVAGDENLLVGAFAQHYLSDEPTANWELVIDLPEQERQLNIKTMGIRGYQVKDSRTEEILLVRRQAIPMNRGTLEIPLNRVDLGLKPWSFERKSLRIRLRTMYRYGDKDIYCDETKWFHPEFNQ